MLRRNIYYLFFLLCHSSYAEERFEVSGIVRNASRAPAQGIEVAILNAQRAILASTKTDGLGSFRFAAIPAGSYLLQVSSNGSVVRRVALQVRHSALQNLEVVLGPAPRHEEITVTAAPGSVERTEDAPQQVNTIGEQEIMERARALVAQVAIEEPGVQLQRTSPTIAGIHIRGLTGSKVNVFLDGVRYSTSAARGGINAFLGLLEPTAVQSVEILRGPASAQYGSDALGGSIQVFSRIPSFASSGRQIHGSLGTSFDSADLNTGSTLTTSFGAQNFGMLATLSGKRVSRLRTGQGLDSHSSLTRFLGLPSDFTGNTRLQDSAFTQYAGMVKMQYAPDARSQFILHYSRSQQDGGKRSDQLLGGDGNLVADLRNLMLDLFYLKFDRVNPAWFDDLTLSYSFNSQREERVNQGGNGDPRAPIFHDHERTGVHGIQVTATKHWRNAQSLVLGAEYYGERMKAASFNVNPISNLTFRHRPRVPNRARFRSGGVYARHTMQIVPDRLRLTGSLRYSIAAYRARALDSPIVEGQKLWPDDAVSASDLGFNAGLVATPFQGARLSLSVSRGFRIPNMTDLGTLGLTGSGFEVAAGDIAGFGATLGSTADEAAVSTGKPVLQVKPESSIIYEAGAGFRNNRIDAGFAVFVNTINDHIAKQALILPQGASGLQIGGQTIAVQTSSGVVFVPASPSPVLVRANLGAARLFGLEQSFGWRIMDSWQLNSGFTVIHAQDQETGLPPDIEGGTPPPAGYFKIRYHSSKRRFWVEPYLHAAYRQDRLSSLDLGDRRVGAMRSRSSIRNFFNHGASTRGLVAPGPDGRLGTSDDLLSATGESILQIQNRVLGDGRDSAPLFPALPGYVTLNLRGGFRPEGTHEFLVDFGNIADRNYRGMSWGIDAPGRGIYIRYNKYF